MEDVSGVFSDEDHPPLPVRHNTGASSKSRASCITIESGSVNNSIGNERQHPVPTTDPKDDAQPGTSSGYICQTSFKRDVVIR